MPPTPPSDSSTGKKASGPTALRSRLSKTGSITRGSTSVATSSLSPKTSNNAHTRSGGIRKPTATAAGSVLKTGLMGPPAGKKPVNEKFDNLFFKSPVPRAISKLLSNSQSTSSTNNNPTVPSSLRRSTGAGPSISASTTTSSAGAAAGAKKARSIITKKPTTTAPASPGQSQKQSTKPTTSTEANGTALVNFTLPNDSQEQVLPTPMGEPSDGDSEGDIIPARETIKPTPKPQARVSLRSSVIPGAPEKLPATRTSSVRGTNGKYNKRTKQAQKESTEEKKAVESPKGAMRNTASSRARAAANAGAGAKSGIKAREVQAGRASAAGAMAMPTTPAAPPRETRSSGLSSIFKNQARGRINAWAEAQKKRSPEPAKEKENEKEEILPPTPEVHIPTLARSSTTGNSPSVSPPKQKPTRKPHSSTLTPGFAIPPGILDETGSLWDSGRRKSRRSLGTPTPTPTSTTTTSPKTNIRRRTTIASGSVMGTSAVGVNISTNRKRKSMSDADVKSIGKKARVSDPEAMETPNGGAGGSGDASKSAPAKGGKGGKGKGKEKVYVNTDFEFSDIEM
ncbi:hypothetical protein B9Z19DRAFT_1062568 [Tuber borchii]|uniref:Uncharacterized protein n=1 Tax=Tuber borchii TaxID=42251 RepID=A0A2T7A1H7_TUBBO|nr:hypothetical protein B9Z19DRAFT_1062568 [Tuber borchii]